MKGAVDIITIIIVACIVVSIGLMLWFYFNSYYSQVTRSGEVSTAKSLVTLSSCMRIEEASQNNFFVRNCGTGFITNNTLYAYVDDNPVSFVFSPSSLDTGKTGTLTLQGVWGISIGQHTLRITNPNVEASALFEAEVPDSCVLALDFDEGSGTIAQDSSGNGNDGILLPTGSEPQWIDGVFGKALKFDGINDYVYLLSINPTSAITVEAWVKSASSSGYSAYWQLVSKYNAFILGSGSIDGKDINFIIYNGTDWTNYSDPYTVNNPQNWHHFMGTYDSATQIERLYIDGGKVNEKPVKGSSINADTGPINIAHREYDAIGTNHFNGTIDSVRIYNQALTPDQTLNFRLI